MPPLRLSSELLAMTLTWTWTGASTPSMTLTDDPETQYEPPAEPLDPEQDNDIEPDEPAKED